MLEFHIAVTSGSGQALFDIKAFSELAEYRAFRKSRMRGMMLIFEPSYRVRTYT